MRELTRREREVIQLAADGHINGQISHHLGIKPETVKTYMETALQKLGATNRAHAAVIALHAGLIAPPW